jgi:acetyl-CoA synthetase
MAWYLTVESDSYEAAVESFKWDLPSPYNIATDLLRKHEDRDAEALVQAYPDGRRTKYTFADLDAVSN